jgi:IS30 family transposase
MMHLLQSYCNRVEATVRLEKLLVKAQKDSVERTTRSRVVPVKPAPKKLSAATNEAIITAYADGARVSELAKQFNVSKWTINHRLNVAGIMHRPNSMSPEQIDEAARLHASGLSVKKIVPIVGFSEGTIWTELKRRRAAES